MVRVPPLGQLQTNHINKEEFMAAKKHQESTNKEVAAAKAPMTKSAMLEQIAQNTV